MSWISFLPPSSAGCALPAITSWIGRSGCSSRLLSRSGSRIISVSRLYDAARRAKPMVSTSGSSAVVDPPELGRGGAALLPRLGQPAAGVVDQPLAQLALDRPDLGAGHLVDRGPEGVDVVGVGVGALRGGEVEHLAGHPGRRVHAVGDRADRDLGLVEGRPQPVEHLAADVAVQLRDAVGALGQPEAHHRHVEDRRVAAGVVLGAEREQLLDRYAGRGAVLAEVLLDQGAREPVDAGRHRRVRGEDRGRAAHLERGVPVDLRAVLGHGAARGSARCRGSRRGPRWCGTPRAPGGR